MGKSAAEYVSTFLLEFLLGLVPKPVDSVAKASAKTFTDQLDLLLAQPRIQNELLEAARKAESDFRAQARKKIKNDELSQAIASFPLWDRELFQSTLRSLPDHVDEELLARDLEECIAHDWKGRFTATELREGVALYLNCLRVHLLKVNGYAALMTQLATLRIDDRTAIIQSGVEELLRRTEKKAQNSARIQIVVEGSLRGFTTSKKEEMVGVLAEVLKIDRDQIRILRVSSGSIVIELELPESAAKELYDLHQIGDPRLSSLGISSAMHLNQETRARKLGDILESLADIHEALGNLSTAILYYQQVGIIYSKFRDWQKANVSYVRAAKIARQMDDWHRLAEILENLAAMYLAIPDFTRAKFVFEGILEIALKKDPGRLGNALANLGLVSAFLDDNAKAIDYYQQALTTYQQTGRRQNEGFILFKMGIAYSELRDAHKAIELYEQALAVVQDRKDRQIEGYIFEELGNAFINLDYVKKATEFYQQALVSFRERGNRQSEGYVLYRLATAYSKSGDESQAINFYEQALTILGKDFFYDWRKHATLLFPEPEQRIESVSINKDKEVKRKSK